MIVMKFGGSSVKNAEMFQRVAEIVKARFDQKPVVVLSAVKGITDNLLESLKQANENNFEAFNNIVSKHQEILKGLDLDEALLDEELNELKLALENKPEPGSLKNQDYISFFGERLSAKILAALLTKLNIPAQDFVSGDIGLITDSKFGEATVFENSPQKIKACLEKINVLPVITGFGGKDLNGDFTTFNRGGSDYVASLIGASIGAEEIQIWTDVNGIMSCDPRVVENTKTIPELCFDEASELAYFGAKVLHPKTIIPAIEKNIPVLVLNTFQPEHPGTKIVKESKETEGYVKAISYKKGITLIDVKSSRMLDAHGYLLKIFEIFEKFKKPVDMIATSEINVSMTVDSKENLDEIVAEVKPLSRVVTVYDKKAIVYVVGASLNQKPGLAGKIFTLLAENKIEIGLISQCSENVSIGFVVPEEQAEKAVRLLHQELVK